MVITSSGRRRPASAAAGGARRQGGGPDGPGRPVSAGPGGGKKKMRLVILTQKEKDKRARLGSSEVRTADSQRTQPQPTPQLTHARHTPVCRASHSRQCTWRTGREAGDDSRGQPNPARMALRVPRPPPPAGLGCADDAAAVPRLVEPAAAGAVACRARDPIPRPAVRAPPSPRARALALATKFASIPLR